MIEKPTQEQMSTLLTSDMLQVWNELIRKIEALYDVDQTWNKGFGAWVYEYKFRRGGKTLCTLYMKENVANILIVLGRTEREKYDSMRMQFTDAMNQLYDTTESYHDGKWLWIPINYDWNDICALLKMKRRPNRK